DIHSKFVDLEWQQRNRLAQGLRPPTPGVENPSQWVRMSGEDVIQRNRYVNVDPFVNNRVRLKVPEGTSDYINASPIALETTKSHKDMRWIATQGPKEHSSHHLWRMIAEESDPSAGPTVIVMLTQTYESGREKCFPYFPDSMENPLIQINEYDEFGDGWGGTVRLLNIDENPVTKSTIRELEFEIVQTTPSSSDSSSADPADPGTEPLRRKLKVWHLLFAAWPDFLVPEGDDRAALVRLNAKSKETAHPTPNPRIVHCSAGVGRSGTFIALDYLLTELDDGVLDSVADEQDPIVDTVDRLRQQRMMMVQGEAQFAFLYAVLRELWVERW
ncbi:receptor/non-receptor type protein-tyrosine phosphatase, partial [Eremomyces bilateralis CBS 781.70]